MPTPKRRPTAALKPAMPSNNSVDIPDEIAKCPYCGSPVNFSSSSHHIYGGTDYGAVYFCSNFPSCDSYVSASNDTYKNNGLLANKSIRSIRSDVHSLVVKVVAKNKQIGIQGCTNKTVLDLVSFRIKKDVSDGRIGWLTEQDIKSMQKALKEMYEELS